MKQIQIKRHPTPRSIALAFVRQLAGRKKDAAGYDCGVTDENGERTILPFSDFVDAIRCQKLWGFANARTRTIHCWIGQKATPNMTALLLGHEYGHLVGKPFKSLMKEERRANEFASVAFATFRAVNSMKWRKS